MKELKLFYTKDFGRDAYYPECHLGKMIALRLDRKAFSTKRLKELMKTHRIEIVGSMYPVPQEFKKYEKSVAKQ